MFMEASVVGALVRLGMVDKFRENAFDAYVRFSDAAGLWKCSGVKICDVEILRFKGGERPSVAASGLLTRVLD